MKNTVQNRECSFIKLHLSLKCSCSLNLDTYLVFHACDFAGFFIILVLFFFFNRCSKTQSLTDFTEVENNQDNTKFYLFLTLFVVSAILNIVVFLYCCICKSGQCNCKTKKRELIIYFTNCDYKMSSTFIN